ncbi:MAG: ATP-binding protein [Prochlorotrichaceae cyanobacterium]
MTQDYRGAIYRAFDLFPLPAGDPAYVDCVDVRGERDVVQELADIIDFAEPGKFTCQLYTGARGCGKSTELLRLEKRLTDSGYYVVYLEADKGDIEIEDTEHTDILLACTRSIISQLKDVADPKPLLTWLQRRLESMKDLALMEVNVDPSVGIEFQIPAFVKLMANFKAVPEVREDVRRQVEIQIPSLLETLNSFIDEATQKLPSETQGIVLIVDNLDRIVPTRDKEGRSNYEQIFLDRRNLMKGLNCHVIYTVPISMVYAKYCPNLAEDYGQPILTPMIVVKDRNGQPFVKGLERLKEMVVSRLKRANVPLTVDDLFENLASLDLLCQQCGGYVRNLMQLMQAAVKASPKLPIPERSVTRAVSEMRTIYRNSIYGEEWQKLAEVALSKSIGQDSEEQVYRELMFRRCVLEYRQVKADGSLECWYDVHPLLESIDEFVAAREALIQNAQTSNP